MNIELKPIAESKVRQLGGDVCGVLVRTQDSEVMAVSEHGRCTRLDAAVIGPEPIIPSVRFTVEPHGSGYAIYRGRDADHHGENLGHLTECMLDLPKMLERALNAQERPEYTVDREFLVQLITDRQKRIDELEKQVAEAARAQGGQGAEVVAWASPLPDGTEQVTKELPERIYGVVPNDYQWYVRPLVYADTQPAVPEWLLEMSRQMREQPNRMTAHPFWQVRCKRYLPTMEGYSEHHRELCGDEGVIYRSIDPVDDLHEYLLEEHEDWCKQWAEANHPGEDYVAAVESWFDPDDGEWPEGLVWLPVQEIEEVVTTHLTQADAEWFIKRKQHDYPALYTFVESAYWSPQLRQLQDWIISLATTPQADGWMPTLDWAVEKCRALQSQGFDRVRLDALEKDFLNAIEAHRPQPPAGQEGA